MRPLLIASVVLSFAVANTAAAQDRNINAQVGTTPVVLVVPASFCPMDPTQPSDARMLRLVRQAQAGQNLVLTQFANCEQLQAWRTGQRKVLDDLGGVTSPLQYAQQSLPYTRPQFIAALAQEYKSKGATILQGATEEVNRKITAEAKNLQINQTKFLGILAQDASGIYIGLLQALKTEFGDSKVQIGVTGITLVKGKMLSVAVYAPAVSDNTATEVLATTKVIVEKTIAANGG